MPRVCSKSIDVWHFKMRMLRKTVKAWAINRETEQNKLKSS
jgi:hypothetical protein